MAGYFWRSMGPILSTFLGLPFALWQALALTLRLAFVTTVVLGVVGLPLASG